MKRVMMYESAETVSETGTVSSYREGLIYVVSDEIAATWAVGEPPTAWPFDEVCPDVWPEPEKEQDEPEEELVDLDY